MQDPTVPAPGSVPLPPLPEDTVAIPIRRRDGAVVAYTIVDAADAEWVSRNPWRLSAYGYARRYARVGAEWVSVLLHRELLELTRFDGLEGDHKNKNRLDNRRCNLRVVPKDGNRQNVSGHGGSSRYRGVCWDKRASKWMAKVQAEGKTHFLGYFGDEQEAAKAAEAGRATLLPYSIETEAIRD